MRRFLPLFLKDLALALALLSLCWLTANRDRPVGEWVFGGVAFLTAFTLRRLLLLWAQQPD